MMMCKIKKAFFPLLCLVTLSSCSLEEWLAGFNFSFGVTTSRDAIFSSTSSEPNNDNNDDNSDGNSDDNNDDNSGNNSDANSGSSNQNDEGSYEIAINYANSSLNGEEATILYSYSGGTLYAYFSDGIIGTSYQTSVTTENVIKFESEAYLSLSSSSTISQIEVNYIANEGYFTIYEGENAENQVSSSTISSSTLYSVAYTYQLSNENNQVYLLANGDAVYALQIKVTVIASTSISS